MRILYLVSYPGDGRILGGIETYGQEVSRAIAARGHEVSSVHLYAPEIMEALTIADRVPRLRWLNRYYWWRGMNLQDYRYHNAVRRLSREAIERFSPDVIHCMHCSLSAAVIGGDTPYIATCHGLEIVDAPPIRQCLQGAAVIHSNSIFTRSRAERIVGNGRHRVLPWGIRVSDVARSDAPVYDLITVGRVVKRKNIDTVIRALQQAPDLRYCVVGDGPELSHLKAMVADRHMENVEFLGAVSDDRRQALLAQSRLFIMCPTNSENDVEGLGLVYFEAQGAGLPAIASRSGGAPEAVGDGGLIVSDPSSESEILRTIRNALEPATYARLSTAVRTRQQTHSWTRFIDAFEELYGDARLVDSRS
jgi:glycosyltransferase involved in cell wall biosynthesis